MPEIKSPFLDNNDLDKNNNSVHSAENSSTHNPQATAVPENNNALKSNVSENKVNSVSAAMQEPKTFDENSVMEIKKDSHLLKNIIITLIIVLILAILGLVLWNFFNKNKVKPVNNNSAKQEQKTIIETPSFEMSGDNFRASSVVVE